MVSKAVDYAKGVAVLSGMVATAFLGSVILLPAAFPLLFTTNKLVRSAYHTWADIVKLQWFTLTILLISVIGGTKFHLYGDIPKAGERALILSNHRTRIDWMMLWGILLQCPGNPLQHLRIVLKKDLKKLPLFGWAMASFRFLFLSRDWNQDKLELSLFCDYYKTHDAGASFLIFPEGTDLSARNLKRSNDYAEKQGWEPLTQVMYPKSTGTLFLFENLKSKLDCVYDITMGYTDYAEGERPSEILMAKGRFPRDVHVHIDRVPIADIPVDEKGFAQDLRQRFLRKEEVLKAFYADGGKELKSQLAPLGVTNLQVAICAVYWVVAVAALYFLTCSWFGLLLMMTVMSLYVVEGQSLDRFIYKNSLVGDAHSDKKRD
eukprot:TRINITY_DN10502_c0_g1_i1.p1 TRINITY_DN10502_c0_g1~~TRINITY_DN10502_c0_g1_i1.p1  ORF type:complete len:376 (+),score=156.01 TRINITY_DN10502_c0_g1_i1:201-1328(+)